jgi:hypothetical protein
LSYSDPEKRRSYAKAYRAAHPDLNSRHTRARIVYSAHQRAKAKGLPFDLTAEDVVVPEVCPVLGIPLVVNKGYKGNPANSPSLDRLIPARGYVKGNVVVMSARANSIKQDAGSEEVSKVAEWLKSQGL